MNQRFRKNIGSRPIEAKSVANLVAGVDVGGTFTDIVVVGPDGITVDKVPSSPPDFQDGFLEALRKAGVDGETGEVPDRIVHGTTITTNAIIEQTGARIGFLMTEGHRDILAVGLGRRPKMYDIFMDPVEPLFLAPRRRFLEVPERIDTQGRVITPLDEGSVIAAATSLVTEHDVEALVVVYINAHANPVHERRTGELLRHQFPDLDITLSSEVLPRPREYRRLVAAGFDAYVKPVIRRYLERLHGLVSTTGSRLLVMGSAGGALGVEAVLTSPLTTVLSGPAAGVVGAARVASEAGFDNVVTLDIGGTSADISLVRNARPSITASASFGDYPLNLPMIDVQAIGAGGSSIAWVDGAGGLKVGPESAGANPGPAAYVSGGTEPTVTDAGLVLGYLNPASFAGGLSLDPEAALDSIRKRIAKPLDIDEIRAALGIHKVVNSTMANALRLATLRKGHDPRDLALVAFGGAGPTHAGRLAAEVGVGTVLIPPHPGVLSALGLLLAPIQHSATESLPPGATTPDAAAVIARLDSILEDELRKELVEPDDVERNHFALLRYSGQAHELEVPLDVTHGLDILAKARDDFHGVHQATHGHSRPNAEVEVVMVRSVHRGPTSLQGTVQVGTQTGSAGVTSRQACFDPAEGFCDVRIFQRSALEAEDPIEGPAIIEQPDTTTVVYPGDSAYVDGHNNLVMKVQPQGSR